MIKVEEVNKAQELWGSGIVKIGELKSSFKECRMYTLDFIKKMYNFDKGSVQFKPTKAADSQFRNDLTGALSYFIGSDSNYIEDGGFAINPWIKVDFIRYPLIYFIQVIYFDWIRITIHLYSCSWSRVLANRIRNNH